MKKMLTLSMIVAATLVFAGCSGSDKPADSSASSSEVTGEKAITVSASNWKFDQDVIEVEKGTKVTITLKNAEGMHGLAIPDYDVDIKKDGGTATFIADKTGEFTIACSIMCGTDHGKMVSKLVVK